MKSIENSNSSKSSRVACMQHRFHRTSDVHTSTLQHSRCTVLYVLFLLILLTDRPEHHPDCMHDYRLSHEQGLGNNCVPAIDFFAFNRKDIHSTTV